MCHAHAHFWPFPRLPHPFIAGRGVWPVMQYLGWPGQIAGGTKTAIYSTKCTPNWKLLAEENWIGWKLNAYVDRGIVFRLLKVELKTEVAFLAQNKLHSYATAPAPVELDMLSCMAIVNDWRYIIPIWFNYLIYSNGISCTMYWC